MAENREQQRQILAAALDHPKLSQSEIAERVGCTTSDVDRVLGESDSEEAMAARLEQLHGADAESAGSGPVPLFTGGLEALGVENMSPMGVAAVGVIAVAALVLSDDLLAGEPFLRWGIVLGSASLPVLVAVVFYRKYSQADLSEAVNWFLGRETEGAESAQTDSL